MSKFVESLKRNYNRNFITIEYLDYLFAEGKLTQEEYEYVKS